LVRRGRATVRQVATLEGAGALWAGWLVGTAYNFGTPHRSTHPGAGSGTDRSSLDDAGTAHLSRAVTAGETAGTTAALVTGGRSCCLTTVPWGTTSMFKPYWMMACVLLNIPAAIFSYYTVYNNG